MMVVGLAAPLDSLGTMFQIEGLAFLELTIYIIPAPFWALRIVIDMLRKPIQIQIL